MVDEHAWAEKEAAESRRENSALQGQVKSLEQALVLARGGVQGVPSDKEVAETMAELVKVQAELEEQNLVLAASLDVAKAERDAAREALADRASVTATTAALAASAQTDPGRDAFAFQASRLVIADLQEQLAAAKAALNSSDVEKGNTSNTTLSSSLANEDEDLARELNELREILAALTEEHSAVKIEMEAGQRALKEVRSELRAANEATRRAEARVAIAESERDDVVASSSRRASMTSAGLRAGSPARLAVNADNLSARVAALAVRRASAVSGMGSPSLTPVGTPSPPPRPPSVPRLDLSGVIGEQAPSPVQPEYIEKTVVPTPPKQPSPAETETVLGLIKQLRKVEGKLSEAQSRAVEADAAEARAARAESVAQAATARAEAAEAAARDATAAANARERAEAVGLSMAERAEEAAAKATRDREVAIAELAELRKLLEGREMQLNRLMEAVSATDLSHDNLGGDEEGEEEEEEQEEEEEGEGLEGSIGGTGLNGSIYDEETGENRPGTPIGAPRILQPQAVAAARRASLFRQEVSPNARAAAAADRDSPTVTAEAYTATTVRLAQFKKKFRATERKRAALERALGTQKKEAVAARAEAAKAMQRATTADNALGEARSAVRTARASVEAKTARMKERIRLAEAERDELRAEMVDLRAETARARAAEDSTAQATAVLAAQAAEANKASYLVSSLTAEKNSLLARVEVEKANAKASTEALKAAESRLSSMVQEIESMRQEVGDAHVKQEEARREAGSMRRAAQEAQRDFAARQARVEELEEEVKDLNGQIASLKEESRADSAVASEADARVMTAEAAANRARAQANEMGRKLEAVEAERNTLHARLLDEKMARGVAETSALEATAEGRRLAEMLEDATSKLADSLAEHSVVGESLLGVSGVSGAAPDDLAALHSALLDDRAALAAELEASQARLAELSTARSELWTGLEDVTATMGELQDLMGKVSAKKQAKLAKRNMVTAN